MFLSDKQGRIFEKKLEENKVNLKKLSTIINCPEHIISRWFSGGFKARSLKLIEIAEYLDTTVKDLLDVEHKEYVPIKKDLIEDKYLSAYEQIITNNDLDFIKENFDKYEFGINVDYKGLMLINVAINHRKLDVVKYLLDKMADSQRSATVELLRNIKNMTRPGINDDLYHELKGLAVSFNDMHFFVDIDRFHYANFNDQRYELSMEEPVFNALVNSEVSLKTISSLITRRIFDLRHLIEYSIELNTNILTEKLLKVQFDRKKPKFSRKYSFIKNEYLEKYEAIASRFEIEVINFDSDIETVYENAILLDNKTLIEALGAQDNKNTLIKYAILFKRLDIVKKFDDGKNWNRKITYDSINKAGIDEEALNKYLSLTDGKFDFALLSGSGDMIDYALEKSKEQLDLIEAVLFGSEKHIKNAFANLKELDYILKIREMSPKELGEFMINHYNRRGIDLDINKDSNPDFEFINDYVNRHLTEPDDKEFAYEKNRMIEAIQDKLEEKFDSRKIATTIIEQVFSVPDIDTKKIGLNFALTYNKNDLAKCLLPYLTNNQLMHIQRNANDKEVKKEAFEMFMKYTVKKK